MNIKIWCAIILLASTFTYAKENRCGWLENPSPANYWLTDKDGEWTISTQGGKSAAGMDKLTEFPSDEFIQTNLGYGYGCACILTDTEYEKKRITKIYKFTPLKLERCKLDTSLHRKTLEILDALKELNCADKNVLPRSS